MVGQVLTDVPDSTIDVLRQTIDTLTAQIEMIVDNPQVLQRHNELKQELLLIDAELEVLQKAFANAEVDLAEQSKDWINQVRACVDVLNKGFTKFMSELHYQGQVRVVRDHGRGRLELQCELITMNDCMYLYVCV